MDYREPGYFLVPAATGVRLGARAVAGDEAARVLGHCAPGGPSSYDPPCPTCGGGGPGGGGMPTYAFHPQKVSLLLDDVPLSYAPPVGPPINFHLSYDHRDVRQPQTIDYGSAGPMWSHNWLSYVTEGTLTVRLRGQGMEFYLGGGAQYLSRAALVAVSTTDTPRYERRLPDGTVEVFTLGDRPANQPNRRIFLTEIIDPQGHSVALTYDSSFRLVAITDAIGQVTTLDYQDSAHPLRVTKVTDPFGRFATLTYDALGRLATVTDTVGMTSGFTYADGDFIQALTTPYGTTTFRQEPVGADRRIEATDPAGGTERMEYWVSHPTLASSEASGDVPTGFAGFNTDLHKYVSLYWDKLALAAGPATSNATITTVMLKSPQSGGIPKGRNVPHSVKRPLESRVWYAYDGQSGRSAASSSQPIAIGRIFSGGASQVTEMTYNSSGMVTSKTDPAGRETTYTYASNGIDLLQVEQIRSGGTDVLQVYADYTSQHLPESIVAAR